jgi:histidinol dehydrogenase
MRIIKISNVESFATKIIPKQAQNNKSIVESILKNVKKNGDDAIRKYEKKIQQSKYFHITFISK